MSLRATMRGQVRTTPTYNEGTLDGGGKWSNWTIEAIDDDVNKVKLRVPSQEFGAGLVVGQEYEFLLECATTGKPRFTVVSFSPAKALARSGA